MLLNGSHPSGLEAIGMVLQNTGILFMFVSILTLNRSFGLAPAHRGLVTHGAYRFVRHPLYASQLVSLAGYCLGYPTAWNLATWSVIAFAQVLRIRAEERLLASDPEYRDYMVSVPTRLVPGLW
jgi:protein-S-isoprenylcysteine O-methyltransferase Ste14